MKHSILNHLKRASLCLHCPPASWKHYALVVKVWFKKRRPASSAFCPSELFLPAPSDLMLLLCAVIMADLLALKRHNAPVQQNHKFIIFLWICLWSGRYRRSGDILFTLLLPFIGTTCVWLPALMVGASGTHLWEDQTASQWQRSR